MLTERTRQWQVGANQGAYRAALGLNRRHTVPYGGLNRGHTVPHCKEISRVPRLPVLVYVIPRHGLLRLVNKLLDIQHLNHVATICSVQEEAAAAEAGAEAPASGGAPSRAMSLPPPPPLPLPEALVAAAPLLEATAAAAVRRSLEAALPAVRQQLRENALRSLQVGMCHTRSHSVCPAPSCPAQELQCPAGCRLISQCPLMSLIPLAQGCAAQLPCITWLQRTGVHRHCRSPWQLIFPA